jgi:hypothetical protein
MKKFYIMAVLALLGVVIGFIGTSAENVWLCMLGLAVVFSALFFSDEE